MTGHEGRRVLVLFGNVPLYGQERGNIDDMEVLRKIGWEVLFVTHREWGHESIQPELDARGFRWTTATFAERFDRGMGLGGWLRRLRAIGRGSWEVSRMLRDFQPNVVHVGNLTWFIGVLPALMLSRTPIVYRLGDSPPRHRAAFRYLWRYVGRRVTLFLCVSRFVCERLNALAHVEHKTHVIYSRPPSRVGVEAVASARRSGGSGMRFGYVGQINEEKGIGFIVDVALKLCAEDPDVRFDLAGGLDTAATFADSQAARVRAAGLEGRIRFLGYVVDIDAFYREIDVHLCPSNWDEALGLTVLEAKVRGIASIVFPAGGLVEIVENGVDGFVCQFRDANSLETACRQYMNRNELAAEHGAAARESLSRLGVDRFEQKLADLYERASSKA